jgi:hypothetical protein
LLSEQGRFIKPGMKATGLICIVSLLAGCAKSRFASDPRAAVVGPAYLDYIVENPPDRDTQFYCPAFTIGGLHNWADPSLGLSNTSPTEISALLINLPAPTQKVKDLTGKGYPDLERKGVRLFTALQD